MLEEVVLFRSVVDRVEGWPSASMIRPSALPMLYLVFLCAIADGQLLYELKGTFSPSSEAAAIQAAAASAAAAAHAAAFRQDPDLHKYQQYLDILRAHYGIQLPSAYTTSAPTQQIYAGTPQKVMTYPVAGFHSYPNPDVHAANIQYPPQPQQSQYPGYPSQHPFNSYSGSGQVVQVVPRYPPSPQAPRPQPPPPSPTTPPYYPARETFSQQKPNYPEAPFSTEQQSNGYAHVAQPQPHPPPAYPQPGTQPTSHPQPGSQPTSHPQPGSQPTSYPQSPQLPSGYAQGSQQPAVYPPQSPQSQPSYPQGTPSGGYSQGAQPVYPQQGSPQAVGYPASSQQSSYPQGGVQSAASGYVPATAPPTYTLPTHAYTQPPPPTAPQESTQTHTATPAPVYQPYPVQQTTKAPQYGSIYPPQPQYPPSYTYQPQPGGYRPAPPQEVSPDPPVIYASQFPAPQPLPALPNVLQPINPVPPPDPTSPRPVVPIVPAVPLIKSTPTTTSIRTTPPTTTTTTTTTPKPTTKPMAKPKPSDKKTSSAASSRESLAEQIRSLPAVLYTRSTASNRIERILRGRGLPLISLYIDKVPRPEQVHNHLEQLTGHRTMPYLFICGTFIGSEEHVEEYEKKGQIEQLVQFVCEKDRHHV